MDDALDRRAAGRAGPAVPAMGGHLRAKGCDLFGKALAGLAPEAVDPLPEHRLRRAVQGGDSAGERLSVILTGDSRARCRISSE